LFEDFTDYLMTLINDIVDAPERVGQESEINTDNRLMIVNDETF
jgi:hypothetical protein